MNKRKSLSCGDCKFFMECFKGSNAIMGKTNINITEMNRAMQIPKCPSFETAKGMEVR